MNDIREFLYDHWQWEVAAFFLLLLSLYAAEKNFRRDIGPWGAIGILVCGGLSALYVLVQFVRWAWFH